MDETVEAQPAGSEEPPGQAPDGGAVPDGGRAPVQGGDAPPSWLRRAALVVGGVLGVALVVALGVVLLPGWWASLVGGWVAGVSGRGVPIGLGIGALCTLAPVIVVLLALRSGLRPRTRLLLVGLALLLALPNVLTAAIASTPSDARSVLAIAAPGFRGATAVGVGATVLLVLGVLVARWWSRRTKESVTEARERAIAVARERRAAADDETRPDAVEHDPDRPTLIDDDGARLEPHEPGETRSEEEDPGRPL